MPSVVFSIRTVLESLPPLNGHVADAGLLMIVSYLMAMNDFKCLLPEDRIRGLLGFCQSTSLVHFVLDDIVDLKIMYTTFSKSLFAQ